MGDWGNEPVRLMNFRERIPDGVRFWLYVFYLIVFQFSNGFYFTTMAQLTGERDLTMTDTHMFGQTVLIGLTCYFPLAFRLKFRFSNRTSLTVAAAALAIINLIFPHVHSFPIMLLLCYLGGFFRLYGTFECFSNLLPKITPTYNYAVFLSFVFFVVLASIHVFDWAAIQIIYFYDWQHVHLLAASLCLTVILVVNLTMRHYRPVPKMMLYGIDPLGMVQWSIFILSAIYVAFYGEQYGWTADARIRLGIGVCLLMLAICFLRTNHIRHSFIEWDAFRQPNLFNMLLLFLCLDILLGTQTVLQNTFTGGILGYGQRTAAWLKFPEFIGGGAGALFCWFTRIKLRWHLKTLAFVSMFAVVVYDFMMLTVLSPATNIEKLWLPVAVLGFGHVGVFIALTVYAQAYSNFKYYFQVLCILGFMRTGLGDAIAEAVWERALTGTVGIHLANIGAAADLTSNVGATANFTSNINAVADFTSNIGEVGDLASNVNAAADFTSTVNAAADLTSQVSSQALLSALQGLYGWAVVFGVAVLVVILCAQFDRLRNPLPKLRQAYTILSRFLQK
ncbi:MAG: hypothetical protein LUC26_05910 [Prevotella sp.]|nr:hypothetical protein [Prevotella sp.]